MRYGILVTLKTCVCTIKKIHKLGYVHFTSTTINKDNSFPEKGVLVPFRYEFPLVVE